MTNLLPTDPDELRLHQQVAVLSSWAKCEDRTARTAHGREAVLKKFEDQVDPEHKLPPKERRAHAITAQKLHLAKASLASLKARRLRREAAEAAEKAGVSA